MASGESGLPGEVLLDVSADALTPQLRARIVPGSVPAGTDRFRAATRPPLTGPAVFFLIFLSVGLGSLWATMSTGFNPQQSDSRFIYAGISGVSLLAAAFSSRSLVHAWSHRGESSRLGCHVVAREGLLIAERGRCSWVPRNRLPAPVDDPSTDTRFGGGGALFVLTDGRGSIKRWTVPRRVGSELDLWRREGVIPDWLP